MGTPANNYGSLHTFKAAAAIVANRAVYLSAAGEVTATAATSDKVIGIATKTVASGEYVEVFCLNGGKHNVVTSAAVTAGDQVMPTASGAGKCSLATTGTTAFGIALSTTAADGESCEVLLRFGVNGPTVA